MTDNKLTAYLIYIAVLIVLAGIFVYIIDPLMVAWGIWDK